MPRTLANVGSLAVIAIVIAVNSHSIGRHLATADCTYAACDEVPWGFKDDALNSTYFNFSPQSAQNLLSVTPLTGTAVLHSTVVCNRYSANKPTSNFPCGVTTLMTRQQQSDGGPFTQDETGVPCWFCANSNGYGVENQYNGRNSWNANSNDDGQYGNGSLP